MTTLASLWDVSLLLCAAALLAIAALLLARVIGSGRTGRRETLRRAMLPAMMRGEEIERGSRLSRKVAATLTLELAELVRGADRDALVRSAESAGAGEELLRKLRSRAPQDRLVAAEALAMFSDHTEEVARVALTDRNPDVRLGAALSLAQEGRAPPPAELVRRLGLGTAEQSLLVVSLMNDFVRTDPHAVEALLYDLDIPDEAKLAATDALAASGAVDHASLVGWMAEASEEETDLRPRILRSLGKIGHPVGHEAILAGLDAESWHVRATAAQAAGRANLKGAVDRLVELLDDEQWWVRFRAGEALTRLGSVGKLELHRAAVAPGAVARMAAKTILAEKGLS